MKNRKLGRIRFITWTVSDVERSGAAFQEWLGMERVDSGIVGSTQADAWKSPQVASSRFVTLRPASGVPVDLRFIEQPESNDHAPLMTYGWNAAECHVRDVHGLAERLKDSPFEIIGPPRDLLDNGSVVAMQVIGPGGELLYLTQISQSGMQQTYGKADCDVDRVFIAVLGVSDQPRTLDHYRPMARFTTDPRPFPITVLARAHGLDPSAARFTIASVQMEEKFRIETDAYPATANARIVTEGWLPPGLAMVSVEAAIAHGERSDIQSDLSSFRTVSIEPGPDGELLEWVEG